MLYTSITLMYMNMTITALQLQSASTKNVHVFIDTQVLCLQSGFLLCYSACAH